MVEFGTSKKRVAKEYKMGNNVIQRTVSEKDLGVTVTNNLWPEKHINKTVGETCDLPRNVRVAFSCVDEEMLRKLTASLELNLTSLEQKRERGDLIAIYRVMKDMDELDREHLITWDARDAGGHGRKTKWDSCRRDLKRKSFRRRATEAWNGLQKDTVADAKSISEFKVKLDSDGTVRDYKFPPVYCH